MKPKTYQSLKAHNFLNNGPIFNPQKVLESSWSSLSFGTVFMSFPRKWKRPRHFPFGQISLQIHVTTLNQPTRSLNSLKSPSSRRHFCDFVRFHPKFHPHLKSKAVRTALLKSKQQEFVDFSTTRLHSQQRKARTLSNSTSYSPSPSTTHQGRLTDIDTSVPSKKGIKKYSTMSIPNTPIPAQGGISVERRKN